MSTQKKNRFKKPEFKKLLVLAVLATYFIAFFLGAIVVIIDSMQLSAFLIFVGTPTTIAISAYCYVVRTENAIKLKQLYPLETSGEDKVDLNNTNM